MLGIRQLCTCVGLSQALLVFCHQAWNCLDWINIILLLVVIGLRISSIVVINNFQVVSALSPGYMDYPPLAQFAITVSAVA